MRFVLLLCVLTGLMLSGCRKKTSPEFYKLEGAQSILVARDGDDAYVSAEMATIIAGLQAVPDDVLEKPRATELVAKLVAEQARVKAERVEKPKPPPVDPFGGRLTRIETAAPPPSPEAEPVDAGEPEPYAGMDEATFDKLFGRCFTKGPNTTAGKGLPATTRVLSTSPDCQKRFGTPEATTSFVFVDGGVWGTTVAKTVVRDGGVTVIPPPPPVTTVADGGGPALIIPGAPLPDGYQPPN